MAGLLDAHRYCANKTAIQVAEKLGAYVGGVFDALNEAQIQKLLACEHGGLNESFAELYSRTGNRHWLVLSETIYHRKVLEPLSRGEDCYSYVIGGNADREYFEGPRSISRHITEQTCESCNSYNMMKLARFLYAQQPRATYFDYYKRTHLNHILAQHHPQTGMFAYMVPMMSGGHREFSTPFDDFWCCVGTGMESHARHGDSIYWTQGRDTVVNLYIPSVLTLPHPFTTQPCIFGVSAKRSGSRNKLNFSLNKCACVSWMRNPRTWCASAMRMLSANIRWNPNHLMPLSIAGAPDATRALAVSSSAA
jgi:DUF1680 family protein